MSDRSRKSGVTPEKPSVTLHGTVEKVIPAVARIGPEKAQVVVQEGEDFYREIRIENTLQDENGNTVSLKAGAEVEVTIEADKSATLPKEK